MMSLDSDPHLRIFSGPLMACFMLVLFTAADYSCYGTQRIMSPQNFALVLIKTEKGLTYFGKIPIFKKKKISILILPSRFVFEMKISKLKCLM